MQESLKLLLSAVEDPWDSLEQVLREHGNRDLGDGREGTALWHLRHICEVLDLHIRTATGGEISAAPPPPHLPAEIAGEIRRQLNAFIDWAHRQPPDRWNARFDYGRPLDLHEMIGVMLRHIIWHAAAVHYWCKWRATT